MIFGVTPLGDDPLGSVPLYGAAGRDAVMSAQIRTAPTYGATIKPEPRFDAESTTEPEG